MKENTILWGQTECKSHQGPGCPLPVCRARPARPLPGHSQLAPRLSLAQGTGSGWPDRWVLFHHKAQSVHGWAWCPLPHPVFPLPWVKMLRAPAAQPWVQHSHMETPPAQPLQPASGDPALGAQPQGPLGPSLNSQCHHPAL